MPAPGEPGRKHGKLALAAADGQIADEKKHLHGNPTLRAGRPTRIRCTGQR